MVLLKNKSGRTCKIVANKDNFAGEKSYVLKIFKKKSFIGKNRSMGQVGRDLERSPCPTFHGKGSLGESLFHLPSIKALLILKIPLKIKSTKCNTTRKGCWRNSCWVFSPAGNRNFYCLSVEDPNAVCKPKTSYPARRPCHCPVPHLLMPWRRNALCKWETL